MISTGTEEELDAALRADDLDGAGHIAEAAIARGEDHEMIYSLAAFNRLRSGDARVAAMLYERAVELAPGNPGILAAAGDAMRHTGQLREAIEHFDRAISLDPGMTAAWYGRALALDAQGRLDEAGQCFARVTELAPATAPGFAGLASVEVRRGRIEAAWAHARRARDLGPTDSATLIALARCEMAAGRDAHAIETLGPLRDRVDLVASDQIIVNELLGDCLDRLDRTDEAFNAYARANTLFDEIHAVPGAPPVAQQEIEALTTGLNQLAPGARTGCADAVPGEAARHVFLFGYPRSGTTLVEQILATAPDVASLEEAPTLAMAAEKYLSRDGLAEMFALDDDSIRQLRADYWSRVARAGIDASGGTFVDMDPFKSQALPLIARLFPRARLVMMHRDPRDVVWSCFRRNFIYSPTACAFTSLDRAARHYDAVMRLVDRCVAILDLDIHILSYEALVRDFDGTTQRLCRYLELPWSERLRDFAETARSRPVQTASGPQVRQPLFDGTGQWRRYARHLDPVLPILEPWIEARRMMASRR